MNALRTALYAVALTLACFGCNAGVEPVSDQPSDDDLAAIATSSEELSSIDCSESKDTGYTSGNAFAITVVTVDGKKVEKSTANAYYVMAQAAAAAGVNLKVVSGFRTMAEQQYLYNCYVSCSCNSCNLAAKPGYSNHQSGHALDLNTSAGGVYDWLNAHGGAYGFKRTVPGEAWHWEYWGGGPGGGPCGAVNSQGCTTQDANNCGNFGCSCVNGQCNGGYCDGNGCTAKSVSDCGNFGCGCVDGQCNGGYCPGDGCTAKQMKDCGSFGCHCTDGKCNGGYCPGQGCTAKQMKDCGNYGCNCVDGECNGGFCPGTGCTAKETLDCTDKGCGCVDHKCSGGQCSGKGCTAKQELDCTDKGKDCSLGKCVAKGGGTGGSATGGATGTGGSATGSGGASGATGSGGASGATGSGGASGATGSGATGGTGGSGASGGATGSGATGGTGSGGSGASGAGASGARAGSDDASDGGCQCQQTPNGGSPPWAGVLSLVGVVWLGRRRSARRA